MVGMGRRFGELCEVIIIIWIYEIFRTNMDMTCAVWSESCEV